LDSKGRRGRWRKLGFDSGGRTGKEEGLQPAVRKWLFLGLHRDPSYNSPINISLQLEDVILFDRREQTVVKSPALASGGLVPFIPSSCSINAK
jgi:hypothetical protein